MTTNYVNWIKIITTCSLCFLYNFAIIPIVKCFILPGKQDRNIIPYSLVMVPSVDSSTNQAGCGNGCDDRNRQSKC